MFSSHQMGILKKKQIWKHVRGDNKFNKIFYKELFQDKSLISGNLMNFKQEK